MDFRKSKILLEKIAALHKSMSSDSESVSAIELDLMKSYIREFYAAFLDLPGNDSNHTAPAVEVIKTEKITRTPEPTPMPVAPPPPPKPEPVKTKVPQTVTPPPPPPLKVEIVPPTIKTEPLPERPKIVTRPAVSPELEELFSFESAKELSEKLSEMPISDIRKAMGLNERIFTVNELFGGDQEAFDHAVAALNRMNSFDEAKNYLMGGVASKYNWTAKDLQKKAKTFIKMVKRRYN